MKTIAMHQPNFVPWMPFFKKIASVDLFVIVSHCQINRIGYQTRFLYRDSWYSMGLKHGNLKATIAASSYANPERDWLKIKRRLPQFSKFFDDLDSCIVENVHDTNMAIIRRLLDKLNIKTPIVFDEPGHSLSTERLRDICLKHGATHYISGPSGRNYLRPELFEEVGIPIEFRDNDNADKRHVFEIL